MPSARRILLYIVLSVAAQLVNEIMTLYIRPKWVAAWWALACLWVLFDGMVVAAQLTQMEHDLKEQIKRNDALHAQNMVISSQNRQSTDNHVLLCELRTRLIHHGQRLRAHQLAGGSWDQPKSTADD